METAVEPIIRCHAQDPRTQDGPIVWRPAYVPAEEPPLNAFCGGRHYSPFQPWRTCAYCGSIHPGDLVTALQAGATLSGSDWKGWPHKFYVHGIPNPYPALPIVTEHQTPTDPEERARGAWTCGAPHPAGPRLGGKWYNQHLFDLADTPLFTQVADLLEAEAGIRFALNGIGQLSYSAPSRGYQRVHAPRWEGA